MVIIDWWAYFQMWFVIVLSPAIIVGMAGLVAVATIFALLLMGRGVKLF